MTNFIVPLPFAALERPLRNNPSYLHLLAREIEDTFHDQILSSSEITSRLIRYPIVVNVKSAKDRHPPFFC